MVEGAARRPQRSDEFLPRLGLLLLEVTGWHVTGSGAGVTMHILDENREFGELMQGLGDARFPGAGHDLVQPTVDLHDLGQGRDGRGEFGVEGGHPLGARSLGGDQFQLGDHGAAQLREHCEQEGLLVRKGLAAGDHQEDRLIRQRRGKGERPPRGQVARLELAGPGEPGQRVPHAVRGALVVISRPAGMPSQRLLAGRDRRDRGSDKPHDLTGRGRLGQDQRQGENRIDRRQPGLNGQFGVVRAQGAVGCRRQRPPRNWRFGI